MPHCLCVLLLTPFSLSLSLPHHGTQACGFQTSEVKPSGVVHEKGKKLTLHVESSEDLNRAVLKSETASIYVPAVELEVTEGTLGGRFTTVEGLLVLARDQMDDVMPFSQGDAATEERKGLLATFIGQVNELISGDVPFDFIIDDPLSNSYIEGGERLDVLEYTRTEQQDDDLGISDMVV